MVKIIYCYKDKERVCDRGCPSHSQYGGLRALDGAKDWYHKYINPRKCTISEKRKKGEEQHPAIERDLDSVGD